MLLSRISGFIRTWLFAWVFGLETGAADAFNTAIRIPNFLQNLLGEGVLSASLIPVYARLLSREHQARADQVARVVLAALVFVTAVLVVGGMAAAPQLVRIIGVGYSGPTRELTIQLVRIFFPGIGLLVVSAWCLAILNSHHRFFLSYVAPVFWNAAIIAALVIFRNEPLPRVAVALSWAALVGAALQLGVQVPTVWRLMSGQGGSGGADLRPYVIEVLTSSIPVIFSRGVVQVSAIIDATIATLLPTGAVTALANATQLYQLPISLVGMAVTSAALPGMSTASATHRDDLVRNRLESGQAMITVLVVPSVVAFLALGDVMVALLFEHGHFRHADTIWVAGVLAGSAVGLLATTVGRLYANAFYAFGDTATPTRFAVIRVVLVAILGYVMAVLLPPAFGIPLKWGAAGLTLSAGFAGWVEFALLRRALARRVAFAAIPIGLLLKAWAAALAAAAVASAFRWVVPPDWLVLRGLAIIGTYGIGYLLLAHAMGLMAVGELVSRVFRRPGRRG
jgi:putative peptidoglycan lipid II flippase